MAISIQDMLNNHIFGMTLEERVTYIENYLLTHRFLWIDSTGHFAEAKFELL